MPTSEDDLSFKTYDWPEDSKIVDEGCQAIVTDGLDQFNKSMVGFTGKGVYVFMRDGENKVVGGMAGYTFGDHLHTSFLWVKESLRNKGNGTKLLKMAEDIAVKRGCKTADLDTTDWQARPFYEKLGYTVFATLDNCPEGHKKHFLKKDLL
jgi:ribosomal protein S18 acetylase RimI-like enzyme